MTSLYRNPPEMQFNIFLKYFHLFIYFIFLFYFFLSQGMCMWCGVVLMCHTMFVLHRIEMYWMHAECCVAFLSVSQHGDGCSHWQQNQSSLCSAGSCWAGQPLSLSSKTCNHPQHRKTHTINIQFTLSRSDLALSLLVFKHFFKHIQLISFSFEKLSTHIGHLAVYFSWFTACLPSPVMEKKGNTNRHSIEMEMRIWYCKLQTASVCRRYACALVCVSDFFKCLALMA